MIKEKTHREANADFTCSQNTSNFANNRFIATQIRGPLEDEADIVQKVVSRVGFVVKPHWETENAMRLCGTDD